METNIDMKTDAGFRMLGDDEQFETYGGFYRGPISAFMIVRSFIRELFKKVEEK